MRPPSSIGCSSGRAASRFGWSPRLGRQEPDVEVSYTLEDGWPYVLVTTTFANRGPTPIDVELLDAIRADRSFELSPEEPADLFWAYDKHFGQAYGVVADGHEILGANARQLLLRYHDRERKGRRPARTRRVVPPVAADHSRVRTSSTSGGSPISSRERTSIACSVTVKDAAGHAVAEADVVLDKRRQAGSLGPHRRAGPGRARRRRGARLA